MQGVRAMLVAAGLGTRLDPLTRELPKPAVPVANRPVALFALEQLQRAGVREVVVNTHHLAQELRETLEPVSPSGVRLRFVHEPQILGTGGGVKNAWRSFGVVEGEDLVIVNAKLVFAFDLERALRVHRESGALATMVLRALPSGSTFAPVEHDASGRVLRIRGLPKTSAPLQAAMFASMQILSARAFDDLPEDGDVIEHSYLKWLRRGEHVQGVIDGAPWLDVGVSLRHYLDANLALCRREIAWPDVKPDARGCIIHPSVRVPSSAVLCEATLGANARVPEGAVLERVVAWQGAELPRVLSDAIVTTRGAIARVAT